MRILSERTYYIKSNCLWYVDILINHNPSLEIPILEGMKCMEGGFLKAFMLLNWRRWKIILSCWTSYQHTSWNVKNYFRIILSDCNKLWNDIDIVAVLRSILNFVCYYIFYLKFMYKNLFVEMHMKTHFHKRCQGSKSKKILRLKNGNGNNIRKHKVVKSQSQSWSNTISIFICYYIKDLSTSCVQGAV